jgi:hypothetical protein
MVTTQLSPAKLALSQERKLKKPKQMSSNTSELEERGPILSREWIELWKAEQQQVLQGVKVLTWNVGSNFLPVAHHVPHN